MAAHAFRAGLWDREGLTTWNPDWYGGHHVPGYSLLFPPIAGVLGPRVAGALGAVVATALFASLASRRARSPAAAALAAWLFASGVAANVVVGRMPFTVGVAFGVAAWWHADRGRLRGAAAASLACVWTSPVAGAFLALAAAGALLARRRATPAVEPLSRHVAAPAALALPALTGGLAVAALWPEGGTEAFVATAFWPHLAVCAAGVALLEDRARPAGVLYLLLVIAVFALPDPLGQNAARLGALAGPALLVLAGRPNARRTALVVVAAALVYLQWLPAVRAVAEAHGDPSTRAGFHAEVLRAAARHLEPGRRVEVVFTRNHWEAAHVAPAVPIARGWSRQRDREVNSLFYDDAPLTATRYRAWLDDMRVGLVALPDVPLDHSARAEAALLRDPPPYLTLVHRSPRWRIWAVDG